VLRDGLFDQVVDYPKDVEKTISASRQSSPGSIEDLAIWNASTDSEMDNI